jgi:Flp pilus assembly protein CpaB
VTGKPTPCVGITISVDQTKGVAGVIVPGDFVNILVTPDAFYCKAAELNAPKHDGTDKGIVSNPDNPGQPGVSNDAGVTICNPARVLYQAARVLFVDKTAVPQPGELTGGAAATPTGTAATSVNTGLITLEVPPRAAQLIASLSPDRLYLTLLPQNYTPEALPKLDPFPTALPGEDANQLTPYGPAGFQSQK